MEKLSMCRMCLAEDIQLKPIMNRGLQEVYERLTDAVFDTTDRRPILACYICCAILLKCYHFKKRCLQSEQSFMQMLNTNMLTPAVLPAVVETKKLKVTSVIHMAIGDELQNNSSCEIKSEAAGIFDEVDVKQEDNEDIEEESLEENDSRLNDIHQVTESQIHILPEIVKKEFPEINISACETVHTEESRSIKNEVFDFHEEATINENELNVNKTTINNALSDIKRRIYLKICKSRENKIMSKLNNAHTFDIKCRKCQLSFKSDSELNEHITLHTDIKRYQCDICKKCFTRKSSLNAHSRIHAGRKPYKCNICNNSFSQKSNLTTHARIHVNEKPYQCNVCSKRFNRKSYLDVHTNSHTTDKPYQCDVCKQSFKRKQSLDGHSRKHTHDTRYICNICKKIFDQKGHLDVHLRIHTGEKPYNCNVCKKSFNIKGNLFKHTRIHSGDKMFTCDTCDRSFMYKSDLLRHIRIHTGEKPYKCKICKKRFAQTSTLNSHVRRNHVNL